MKKLRITSLIILSVFCMSLFGCSPIDEGAVSETGQIQTTAVETTSFSETQTVTTAKPEPEIVTVSFSCTGDNLIHSSIYKQAYARDGGRGYDFAYAYENVTDLIEPADLAVINQETLICNDIYEPSTYPRFNSPSALGDYMLDIGFDVFTIANNHTLDMDEDGLKACLDYWDKHPEAIVAGAYRNKEDSDKIRTKEVDGVVFSFLSYTEFLNGLSLPSDSEMVIGNSNKIPLMISQIKKAKEISDVCVVSLHWGVENSDIISDAQRSTAKLLADAGADIIIGNHPHVLRDIEMIEASDGTETLCAYSLGNFISAQNIPQNLIGGVLQFNINVNMDDKSSEITDIELIPIVTHYDYGYKDIRVYKLSDYTKELADTHGVKAYGKFSLDYINNVLKNTIDEKYLDL